MNLILAGCGGDSLKRTALFSPCGRYRLQLGRTWGKGPQAAFVMLNPSTADAQLDDPTIRRCISFAVREGCGALAVVNLFAFRTPKPAELLNVADPVGGDSAEFELEAVVARSELAICAWGAAPIAKARADQFAHRNRHRELYCLGTTKSGAPKHPLYVPNSQPLVRWN